MRSSGQNAKPTHKAKVNVANYPCRLIIKIQVWVHSLCFSRVNRRPIKPTKLVRCWSTQVARVSVAQVLLQMPSITSATNCWTDSTSSDGTHVEPASQRLRLTASMNTTTISELIQHLSHPRKSKQLLMQGRDSTTNA